MTAKRRQSVAAKLAAQWRHGGRRQSSAAWRQSGGEESLASEMLSAPFGAHPCAPRAPPRQHPQAGRRGRRARRRALLLLPCFIVGGGGRGGARVGDFVTFRAEGWWCDPRFSGSLLGLSCASPGGFSGLQGPLAKGHPLRKAGWASAVAPLAARPLWRARLAALPVLGDPRSAPIRHRPTLKGNPQETPSGDLLKGLSRSVNIPQSESRNSQNHQMTDQDSESPNAGGGPWLPPLPHPGSLWRPRDGLWRPA
eukprot:gene13775-biopygen1007